MWIAVIYFKLPTDRSTPTCIPQDYCHKIQCIALANSSHFRRYLQSNLGQSKEQTTRYLILKKKKNKTMASKGDTHHPFQSSKLIEHLSRDDNLAHVHDDRGYLISFFALAFFYPMPHFPPLAPSWPFASQTYMGIFLNNASKFLRFCFCYF